MAMPCCIVTLRLAVPPAAASTAPYVRPRIETRVSPVWLVGCHSRPSVCTRRRSAAQLHLFPVQYSISNPSGRSGYESPSALAEWRSNLVQVDLAYDVEAAIGHTFLIFLKLRNLTLKGTRTRGSARRNFAFNDFSSFEKIVEIREVCSPISSMDSPRNSPSFRAVSFTKAGSLRLPRCGTGARYGASVSINMRSSGTSSAASRICCAWET